MRWLFSECSVPESGGWVGLAVAFLWVLGSLGVLHSPGRAGRWGSDGVVCRGPFVWFV